MRDFAKTAMEIARLVPGPVVVADGEGRIRHLGAGAATLLGLEINLVDPDGITLGQLVPDLALPREEGDEQIAGFEVESPDGRWISLGVRVVRVETWSGPMFVATLQDLRPESEARRDAEARRWMLDVAGQIADLGVWSWDLERDEAIWSDRMFEFFGFEPGEFTPTFSRFLELFHPDDRDLVRLRIPRILSGAIPADYSGRALRADGETFQVEVKGRVVRDDSNRVRRIYGVIADVSARSEAELDHVRLEAVMECSNEGIVFRDPEGRVESANATAERIYGRSLEDAAGRSADELLLEAESREARLLEERLSTGESEGMTLETIRTRPDGRRRRISLSVAPIHDRQRNLAGTVAVVRDLSASDEPATTLPDRDSLTGLRTGAGFTDLVTEVLGSGEGALLHLDIDNLKLVNQFCGYGAGDRVVRGVAQILERECVGRWPLARVGGDEFAVLLPEAGHDAAERAAERLLRLVRGFIDPVNKHPVTVTASIGGVVCLGDGQIPTNELMARAHGALDRAKQLGRDTWIMLEADRTGRDGDELSFHEWGERIRRVLAEDRIELYLQPIVEVTSGETVSFEALLRINDSGTVEAPGPFLANAERLGLIHAVDRAVMRRAFDLLEANPRLTLAVNISGGSLGDDQLLEMIREAIALHRFDPACLVIELTETATMIDAARAYRFASALEGTGCSFAIDDFGTGYGSYDYVRNIAVDYLKIDGQFVREWTEVDEAVVGSLVTLAQGLDKQTVAECVESGEALEHVSAAGVDLVQGFHIGRPIPAEEALEAIA